MEPLSFHHVCLSVSDAGQSVAFYAKLGFKKFHFYEDDTLSITHIVNGSMLLELVCYHDFTPAPASIFETDSDLPVIGTKHFGLRVHSAEAAKSELEEQGIVTSPIKIKRGRTVTAYFFIADPDGILVEMVQDDRPGLPV